MCDSQNTTNSSSLNIQAFNKLVTKSGKRYNLWTFFNFKILSCKSDYVYLNTILSTNPSLCAKAFLYIQTT